MGMLANINELIRNWAKTSVSRKTELAREKSKLKPFQFSTIKSKRKQECRMKKNQISVSRWGGGHSDRERGKPCEYEVT